MTIRPRHLLTSLGLALGAWVAVLALALRLGAGAPAALVVLPPEGLIGRLPAGVAVTDAGPLGLTVRAAPAARDGLPAALYAAGAPLVLPAGLAGCLGLEG